jgi:hypothetical protein
MRPSILAAAAAAALALGACGPTRVNVAPVTVQPIHVTIDVNLRDAPPQPAKRSD